MPDVFANDASFTTTGIAGTGAPASGTSVTFSVAALSAAWPALTGDQTMTVQDPALPSELLRITASTGAGATSITITRGADGTTPLEHEYEATFVCTAVASALNGMLANGGTTIVDPGGTGAPGVKFQFSASAANDALAAPVYDYLGNLIGGVLPTGGWVTYGDRTQAASTDSGPWIALDGTTEPPSILSPPSVASSYAYGTGGRLWLANGTPETEWVTGVTQVNDRWIDFVHNQTLTCTISGALTTTVGSGSNGGTISGVASWSHPSAGVLDTGTLPAGFPTSGQVSVAASGSTTALVNYTGVSGNSLTGCTYVSGSASGTVATGGAIDSNTAGTWVPGFGTAPPANLAVFFNRSAGSAGNSEIFYALNDGSAIRQITDNPSYQTWWPKVSPDGSRIAFLRAPVALTNYDSDYTQQSLWVANVDGTNPVQIVAESWDGAGTYLGVPNWTPDSRELVFFSGTTGLLYIVRSDGSNTPVNMPVSGVTSGITDPSVSPDGQTVVFIKGYNVWTVPMFGGTATELTTGGTSSLPYTDPNWSFDNSTIVFLSQFVAVDGTHTIGQWGLQTIQSDGTGQTTILNDGNGNSKGVFGEDGYIYFHRLYYGSPAGTNPDAHYSLAKIRSDGTGSVVRLTDGSVRDYQPDVHVSKYPRIPTKHAFTHQGGSDPIIGVVLATATHTTALSEATIVTSGTFTDTLPAPTADGECWVTNTGSGTVTVATPSGTLYNLSHASGGIAMTQGVGYHFVSNGTNWYASA